MAKKSSRDVLHDGKNFVLDGSNQKKFGFVEQDEYDFEIVCQTRDGFGLYRRKEGHGGYSYWTDEAAPGVMVFDEGLTNILHIFEAMDHLGEGETMWKHIGEVFGYRYK